MITDNKNITGYTVRRYIIFAIIPILFLSCGRWKTTKLKSDKLCSIDSGSNAGNVMLSYDKNNILDTSFRIEFHQGNIYTADNILKRVQVLDKNGTPLLFIGPKDARFTEVDNVKKSNFNFSIIGSMAVDSVENIYIQNRFTSSKSHKKHANNKKLGFSPTYILVFNKSGNLLYTLGKRGSPDIPFNYIENMEIDKNDRLFVITRSYDTWSVFEFYRKKRIFYTSFGDADFNESDDNDEIFSKIENIKIYKSGENLLISVAYYQSSEFLYRKIFNYLISKRKIDKTIINIPDPQNELFTLEDDKHIYLWDVGDKNVKFIICNFNGNIINNILIKFPGKHESYSDILIDESGQFYSYHVSRKRIDILKWR